MERRRSQRGQAIVLVALMMAVLIGFVALALDSARAFDGRRVLQDSVDAAALTAAESLQNGGVNWGQAQLNAITIFQKDNRLPVGPASCSPSTFFTPNPGSPGTAVTTTCSMSGGGGYVLTLNVADNGPAGQVFALSATRPLSVALMQVLGQSPTLTLTAAGAATAGDQSVTPALAGLSRPSCSSGTYPITISSFTNFATVVGDVVSNGPAYLGTNSYLHLAGDLLASCSTNSNADHVTYQCWSQPPTLPPAAPPCTGNAVLGQLRSTANHFADPGYLPPSTAGLTTPGFVSGNIHLAPGIYTTDPQFGSPSNSYCYFLAGGVYNWQAGLTISHGIVSNELKPPDEPLFNNNQALAPQFWNDNGATCAGSYSLTTGTLSGKGIGTGTWSVVVTSVHQPTGNINYRESAPSMCRQVAVSGSDKVLIVAVNNVPGATAYNVYAQPPGLGTPCGGPFGLVKVNSVPNSTWSGETQGNLGTTPSVTFSSDDLPNGWSPNALGQAEALRSYPPDGETGPFTGGLPNGNAARGSSPSGDRANENGCANAAGQVTTCPAAVTPGAVAMYLTNGGCLNVTSTGDAYLFSGFQYNWLLNFEPLATTCPNYWQGVVNSAPIGMSYSPGASFRFQGDHASESNSFGGVVAASVLIQSASGIALYFNSAYAPRPPGTRLTG